MQSQSPRPLFVQVFQHAPFEGLGSMASWFRERGHAMSHIRWFAGDRPRGAGPDADWLVVMGGPMGVHDESVFPWLREEKKAIEAALKRGAAVLGICLGAQLVAHVLGAEVGPNSEKEIGWFPVDLSPAAAKTWLSRAFPPRFTPFHWHGDTFGIPKEAVSLGRSAACENQGFLYGENVLGLQFHPEITAGSLSDLVTHCGGELAAAGTPRGAWVQDKAALTAGLGGTGDLNAMMARVCERLESRAACV